MASGAIVEFDEMKERHSMKGDNRGRCRGTSMDSMTRKRQTVHCHAVATQGIAIGVDIAVRVSMRMHSHDMDRVVLYIHHFEKLKCHRRPVAATLSPGE